MSADFWAGYISGAAGIIIGNPLDLIKTRLQTGDTTVHATSGASLRSTFDHAGALVKGAAAPVIGYGALNGLLYFSYNRGLVFLGEDYNHPTSLTKIWAAGAAGGLATFIVSAPTELIKCRAQVSLSNSSGAVQNSLSIAKEIWAHGGLRGLYFGGGITSVRDAVGYGFYFWSYELSKRVLRASEEDTARLAAVKVLFAGGIAGIVTWASIFPLDVIKTRVQTQAFEPSPSSESPPATSSENTRLLPGEEQAKGQDSDRRKGAIEIARRAYRTEGSSVFFRGLGICSVRAFIVNAIQWAIYEWMMQVIQRSSIAGVRGDTAAAVVKANSVSV